LNLDLNALDLRL